MKGCLVLTGLFIVAKYSLATLCIIALTVAGIKFFTWICGK
jgi:hypothetical protein